MSDSWGNLYQANEQRYPLTFRGTGLPEVNESSLLAVGRRRSYGDVGVNDGGAVLDATGLSRFIHFDLDNGILRCEAGVTLWEVLRLIVPKGWFLPVTPGTSFVTIGGALANDVHGKNHHGAGSFGCFVRRFELRRSDGEVLECDPHQNADYFAATIGGCGLTGLITWVEFSLKKIVNPSLDVESIAYSSYAEFLSLSADSEQSHEYNVSWIDCLASGADTGRGVFLRANHVETEFDLSAPLVRSERTVPLLIGKGFPLVNQLSLAIFNRLYLFKNRGRTSRAEPFGQYFYPLDSLLNWNRIYGRRGFYQFQCVVPLDNSQVIADVLGEISQSGQGSFLSVLKTMGDILSPGMISFPRPGVTLALDFPNRQAKTLALLSKLESMVVEAGGAIYPAKDAVMSGATFRQCYLRYEEFSKYIDPRFSSGFWRRVNG